MNPHGLYSPYYSLYNKFYGPYAAPTAPTTKSKVTFSAFLGAVTAALGLR